MNKNKNRNNKVKAIVMLSLALCISLFLLVAIYFMAPIKNGHDIEIEVTGNKQELINELANNNLIRNRTFAYYYLKIFKANKHFNKGIYTIKDGMGLNSILDHLGNPENSTKSTITSITIIPGDWCKHIAKTIAENTSINSDDLMNYWKDAKVFDELSKKYTFLTKNIKDNKPYVYLEGYLAPDTYEVRYNSSVEEVTEKLLDQTQKIFNERQEKIKASKLNPHEIFTLASIVQYESGAKKDNRLIAGVFFNRLNEGMMLQSSPTRCYIIGQDKEDFNWSDCEINLKEYNAYDTYQVEGLPPGPISNPGVDAIEAVLDPEATEYLYFIGDLNNNTYFAKTFEEHEKNICKYLTKDCE